MVCCFQYSLNIAKHYLHIVLYKDYLFPKNTMIIPLAYAIHKDPVRYPEPDKFKPERFIDDLKSMTASTVGNIAKRDHFVFGWGRRICPGAHLVSHFTQFSA